MRKTKLPPTPLQIALIPTGTKLALAEVCQVSPSTVTRWAVAGYISDAYAETAARFLKLPVVQLRFPLPGVLEERQAAANAVRRRA